MTKLLPTLHLQMPSSQSLTQSHPAVKLLTKKLRDGSVAPHEKAADVHRSDPVFAKTPLRNFRTCYVKTKRKLGLEGNFDSLIDDEANIDRRCTEEEVKHELKRQRVEEVSDEEEQINGHEKGSEILSENYSFRPLLAYSTWKEPRTTTKRVSLVIVLPTRVDGNDFSVHVVGGCQYLEFKCCWPKEIIDVDVLHRKCLLSEDIENRIHHYHPKLLGFEASFKKMRARASDSIQSSCRIVLPFTVETHIVKTNLQWRDSITRVAYVELRAAADEYGITNSTESFELV